MGDSVAKVQVIENPGTECSRDYTKRASPGSIPVKDDINEKERLSSHYGFMPTINHQVVHSYPSHYQPHPGRQTHFNMRTFGAALPDVLYQGFSNASDPRCMLGTPQYPNQFMYHVPQLQQFPAHTAISTPSANLSYYAALQAQLQNTLMVRQNTSPNLLSAMNVGNYSFQSPTYGGQAQASFFLQHSQYPMQNQVITGSQSIATPSMKSTYPEAPQKNLDYPPGYNNGIQDQNNASVIQSQSVVVRGPPRKPRQSGHAIWIGNLPPHTEIMNLVHHVCKEVKGLESLFLISKSNCAFANFRDESACTAAQLKIHDSRFQTVRLVSRLRRGSSTKKYSTTVPTGPSASTKLESQVVTGISSPRGHADMHEIDVMSESNKEKIAEINSIPKDKFFVVKSLTVEDLELSVKSGIWATQSHNEKILNEAFKTSDNVFLIFSANKSGEYFGYARMASPINDDPAAAVEFASKARAAKDPILPNVILSPATSLAPKGRIIDDSARGTIFWEVDRDGDPDEDDAEDVESDKSIPEEPPPKLWGKPFEVEWVSTIRLPFHRTRGLRNPWNSNREVKIARDGTELETTIGRKLIALFHRLPSPIPLSGPGISLPLIGGFQHIPHFS